MYTNTDLFDAIRFARRAHCGQTYGNTSYIEGHLKPVANLVKLAGHPLEYQIVAILHDIIEDTDTTAIHLDKNFPTEIVDAVVAITHLPEESYHMYMVRVSHNRIARVVKFYDSLHNLTSTVNEVDDAFKRRVKKYAKNIAILQPLITF